MPKFTQEELEEIKRNTEAAEAAREAKAEKKKKNKSEAKKKKRSKKKSDSYSLKERLFALVLLLCSLGISAVVWFLQ